MISQVARLSSTPWPPELPAIAVEHVRHVDACDYSVGAQAANLRARDPDCAVGICGDLRVARVDPHRGYRHNARQLKQGEEPEAVLADEPFGLVAVWTAPAATTQIRPSTIPIALIWSVNSTSGPMMTTTTTTIVASRYTYRAVDPPWMFSNLARSCNMNA